MAQSPCLLTSISADASRVVFQNAASQAYYGDLVSYSGEGGTGAPNRGTRAGAVGRLSWGDAVAALVASAVQPDAAECAAAPDAGVGTAQAWRVEAEEAEAAGPNTGAAQAWQVLHRLFAAQPPEALQVRWRVCSGMQGCPSKRLGFVYPCCIKPGRQPVGVNIHQTRHPPNRLACSIPLISAVHFPPYPVPDRTCCGRYALARRGTKSSRCSGRQPKRWGKAPAMARPRHAPS